MTAAPSFVPVVTAIAEEADKWAEGAGDAFAAELDRWRERGADS